MAKLPKYTLDYNEKRNNWSLGRDSTGLVVKTFDTKDDATRRNALRRVLGDKGGSVKIQKMNGRFQEERTFPRSSDPKKSKG